MFILLFRFVETFKIKTMKRSMEQINKDLYDLTIEWNRLISASFIKDRQDQIEVALALRDILFAEIDDFYKTK